VDTILNSFYFSHIPNRLVETTR